MDAGNNTQELSAQEIRELRRILEVITPEKLREWDRDHQERERRKDDVRALWMHVAKYGVGAVLTALAGVILLGVQAWINGKTGTP